MQPLFKQICDRRLARGREASEPDATRSLAHQAGARYALNAQLLPSSLAIYIDRHRDSSKSYMMALQLGRFRFPSPSRSGGSRRTLRAYPDPARRDDWSLPHGPWSSPRNATNSSMPLNDSPFGRRCGHTTRLPLAADRDKRAKSRHSAPHRTGSLTDLSEHP